MVRYLMLYCQNDPEHRGAPFFVEPLLPKHRLACLVHYLEHLHGLSQNIVQFDSLQYQF